MGQNPKPEEMKHIMKTHSRLKSITLVACLFAVLFASGCASTKISNR